MLSADGAEERKVAALDDGADDYVTKPFSMPELLARVRVALRHRRALAAVGDEGWSSTGSLRVDIAAHDAIAGRRAAGPDAEGVHLAPLLARNVGKVLTHGRARRQVWGPDQPLDTLRTHVSHLRRKLGGAGEGPELDRPGCRVPPRDPITKNPLKGSSSQEIDDPGTTWRHNDHSYLPPT